jgi:tetratricopeptide (TPR) repeat protein
LSNFKRWLIFGGSVVALSLSVFLGYWWVVERPARMTGDRTDEVQQRPPEDVEVTLPQNLREEMTEQSERRERLYQEALQFHREGQLDRAVERYQEVLSISVPDETAAEAYRLLGDIYLRADNPRRAIRLYEYAVRIVEDSPLYHYRLGRAHEEIGEFSEASSSYERAIDLDPAGLYYLARGNLAYDQGEYAQAIEFYEEGLNQDDQQTRLLVNLAKAHQQQGQSSQAIETFEQALDRELSNDRRYDVLSNIGDLHMDRGEPTEAVNAFEEASSIRDTAEAYYNLGQARLEAGLLSGAVDALESAREEAPEDADIRVDLGFAYQRLGNQQEAVQQYERAIELRPDDNDLYLAAARLHERLNQPTRALIYYRELTNRLLPGPQLGLVYRRVGELYMKTDYPDSAAPAFRNALKIDTGNAEVTYNLGVAYQRTNRVDQSVEQFRRALELAPSDTHYQFVYASSLYRAGFRKRARREFLELFERAPDRHRAGYMVAHIDYTWGRLERSRNRYQALLSDVEDTTLSAAIYRNLGNIYTRNGEYARAETVLKQSLSIREDPVTYYNLGVTYAEQGAWTEANTSFREAIERGPEDARFYAGVGLAMYERGVYEVAERHLQRSLELDPDLTRARYDLRRVRRAMEES